jgi:hypothetical protein
MVLNPNRQSQSKSIDDKGWVYSTGDKPAIIAQVASGQLTIQRRSHGTVFSRSLPLAEIVNILDPKGTAFIPASANG